MSKSIGDFIESREMGTNIANKAEKMVSYIIVVGILLFILYDKKIPISLLLTVIYLRSFNP